MLHFDHASHTYSIGEERLPSVTQVLDMLTDLDQIPAHKLRYAAERGDAVHFGCELHDRDQLDWDSVESELTPYIEGWIKFRQQTGFEPDRIEHRMFHPVMRFAGTLDRTGILYDKPTVLDIKAVVKTYPTTGPQLAAYEALLKATEPDGPKAYERYAVQLCPDGTYRLHHYEDRSDFSVFVSALTLWKWAHRNEQRIHYEPKGNPSA